MDENIIVHKLLDIFEYKNEYQLRTSNIQPQDMYILERIHGDDKMTSKELSRRYHIPTSTLTGIIDRLERKKLIERLRTNSDRRTIELIVTPEGKEAVEKHIKEDLLFSSKLFNSLEQEEKEKLKELLIELLAKVNKNSLFSPEDE